ncbi:MFS transporter [Streptomyces sp. NBC_01754]|uniref:MDR family MFS transporter n=1 Tax=Streptomyces sp. NBC_01754 TaxID=2975930 RepID=UPI002DDA5907|nr:MDR family MFS transporter [Streptomyces sp. NBC_01754]WSC90841.1 MFS transporter [Streptomyces sp. NBC_01754]WSC96664.1 MFS transporter [Streptomyces sp. NBC_01754]
MSAPTTDSNAPQTGASPAPDTRISTVIAACMLAIFLAMLDSQIVATALPRIVGDLGGLDQFAWVTTAYIIASSVTTPVYGKLGDLFGRKKVFLVAIAIFVVGSATAGAAQSMEQLILFRTVQGVGAGGLFVSVLAIIGDLFSPREGAKYFNLFGIVFAAAALAGPAVGGVLTDLLSWHWVFLINLPLGVIVFVLVAGCLHLPPKSRRAHIDYAGFITLSAAIVALTLLASWGGVKYDWISPQILGLAALSIVMGGLFVAAERRAPEPVIPLHLFRDSTFSVSVLVSIAAGIVFLGAVNFLALYIQVVTGASPTMSGVVLLPMMFGLVAASVVSGQIITKTGRYKWYPVLSMATGIAGALLLSTMDTGTPRVVAIAYMLLFGIAAGLNMQVLTMAAQNTAPRDDIGAVHATVAFTRQLGSTLGISVFAAIFYNRLTEDLAKRVPAGALDGIDHNSLSSNEVLTKLAAPVRDAVEHAYAAALSPVFLAAVPVLVVGLGIALLMKNMPLRSWDHGGSEGSSEEHADRH